MADQEFLASFAVDIDEAGVAWLQKILADNKALADNVSAAFRAAAKAMKEFAGRCPPCLQIAGLIRVRRENEARAADAVRA